MTATHEVTNQVPPLVGHDPIAGDAALAEACTRHADETTLRSLGDLGDSRAARRPRSGALGTLPAGTAAAGIVQRSGIVPR